MLTSDSEDAESAARMSANATGAAWMTLGMAGYVVNDSLIKLVAEDVPLFQAIFIRGGHYHRHHRRLGLGSRARPGDVGRVQQRHRLASGH